MSTIQDQIAAHEVAIECLKNERKMLDYKSFAIRIEPEQKRIDADIHAHKMAIEALKRETV